MKKLLLIASIILLTTGNSLGQEVSDSLKSFQQEIQKINDQSLRIYYQNRFIFYKYMVEHFPRSGSGRHDMKLEFGGMIQKLDKLIYMTKILRLHLYVDSENNLEKDLAMTDSLYSKYIEDYKNIAKAFDDRAEYLSNQEFKSYNISKNVIENDFLPAITAYFTLFKMVSKKTETFSNYLEGKKAYFTK